MNRIMTYYSKHLFCAFLFSIQIVFGQSHGFAKIYESTMDYINDICIVNRNVVYGVGWAGVIVKTTDGGNSWDVLQSPSPGMELCGVAFTDANTGVATNGKMFRTTNGGVSWDTISLGDTVYLNCIRFANASIGYAVGGNGLIVKTTDGGLTWIPQLSGTSQMLWRLSITDANTVTAVGLNPGIVIRTTDGGAHWNSLTIPSSPSLWGVSFVNANYGTVVGSNGSILHTTNGGSSWEIQNSGTSDILWSVDFTDTSNGTAVGSIGTILRTTDGGKTWSPQISNLTGFLFSVKFLDNNFGITAGGNIQDGKILSTTDGGNTWVLKAGITDVADDDKSSILTGFNLKQNFPNPFNPSTTIRYSIPKSGHVSLAVYDMLGKEVTTLVNEVQEPRERQVQFNGENLSSGMYFFRLESGGYSITKKFVLHK